jgi:HSP20 family protein
MRTYWSDLERTLAAMDDFRRRIDREFQADGGREAGQGSYTGWPAVNIFDSGSALLLTAEVPGLTDKDVQLTLNQDVLTVSGERKTTAPEGYSIHRQERVSYKFSRSFTLPSKVNPEKTTAAIKNGILTITLDKAPEAKPRQISIKAS